MSIWAKKVHLDGGIEIAVRGKKGTNNHSHLGALVMKAEEIICCKGRKQEKNGRSIPWNEQLAALFDKLP